jgi:hypothetical protein
MGAIQQLIAAVKSSVIIRPARQTIHPERRIDAVLSLDCRLVGLLALVGCATDPEQAVVGKWAADSSAMGNAARMAKLKADAPDADPALIRESAKAMGAYALELKAYKSCTAIAGGNKFQGTWSFDKEQLEVQIDLKTAELTPEAEAQNPEGFKPRSWMASLDEDHTALRLAMVDRGPEKDGKGAIRPRPDRVA